MELIYFIYIILILACIALVIVAKLWLDEKEAWPITRDMTNWEKLVKSKRLMDSVDFHNDLNVDQREMWSAYINNYVNNLKNEKSC